MFGQPAEAETSDLFGGTGNPISGAPAPQGAQPEIQEATGNSWPAEPVGSGEPPAAPSASGDAQSADPGQNQSSTSDDIQQATTRDQAEYYEDIRDAADTFYDLEKDALKRGDASIETLQQNVGYAVVRGTINAGITATIPKNGDPDRDALNDLTHTIERMPHLDWTLAGVRQRIQSLRETLTGIYQEQMDALDKEMQQIASWPNQ
jgi:hypothetical protein